MCSIAAQRIAEFGRAIDDLAVKAGPQTSSSSNSTKPVGAPSANTPFANAQPMNAQPANAQPANAHPANAQPMNAQPANTQCTNIQPANSHCTNAQCTNAQSDLAKFSGDTSTGTEPIDPQSVQARPTDTTPIFARVAELWAQLAELDPEVARRLIGYQALATPTSLPAPTD
jgi:hypothetical protein